RRGRYRYVDRKYAKRRSADPCNSDGNQGAAECCAAKCFRCLAAGWRLRNQPPSTHAGDRGVFNFTLRRGNRGIMNRKNEKGVALILALILILVMSVMAISLMFISQSETWASLNYRLTSQARDGAEAGVNSAANYIMNMYIPPASTGTDPLSGYNYTSVYPVQVGSANTSGHDAYLSANTSTKASTYPISSIQTAFNTTGRGKGSFAAGNATVNYATYARLLSMTKLNSAVSGSQAVVQTWEITSDGTISGIR